MGRAVVFPGQGSVGGGLSGRVLEAVRGGVGDGEVPYQVAVFGGSVEIFYGLRGAGVGPDLVAGHSLGEYAAAHAAGSLSLEGGVRLVAERDRLMAEASRERPGVMAALIGADPREVERAVGAAEGVVVAANFNTPRQTVISGEEEAVEAVAATVGGRKKALGVSGAFHSPLMRGASEEMAALLDEAEFADPEVPMVSAADGAVLETAGAVREALRGQMLSPVRWVEVIDRFVELGVGEIVEAGADGTLTRMLRDFKRENLLGNLVGRAAKEVLA